MEPETHYIDRRGKNFAYQSLGSGPRTVAICADVNAHPDLMWTDPHWTESCERLAQSARVLIFQLMGVGLSDTIDRIPTLEEQASDVAAVLDAEGVESAVLVGAFSTTPPIMLLAANEPQRVDGLLLMTPFARGWKSGNFEPGSEISAAEADALAASYEEAFGRWGEGRMLELWDPVIAPANRRNLGIMERTAATPAVARAVFEASAATDIREALPLIQAPTRVLSHPSYPAPQATVRLVVDLIPNATYHELPPTHPQMSLGEAVQPAIEHVLALIDVRSPPAGERQLASILFTDIVGSTELVVQHGDAEWRTLLGRHERQIEGHVKEWGGRLVKLVGDGSVSVFPGPAAAIRAARAICADAPELGLQVRAGVHTGECDRRPGGDISGLAVHIAARVGAASEPSQVWVSRTVRDLVGGSGLELASRGSHQLKGVNESWELFALGGEDHAGAAVSPDPPDMRPTDRLAVAAARRAPGLMRSLTRMDNARRRFGRQR